MAQSEPTVAGSSYKPFAVALSYKLTPRLQITTPKSAQGLGVGLVEGVGFKGLRFRDNRIQHTPGTPENPVKCPQQSVAPKGLDTL